MTPAGPRCVYWGLGSPPQRNAYGLQVRGLHVPGNDRGNARPLIIRIRTARLIWIAPQVPARAGTAGAGAAWPCWRDAVWLLRGDLPGVHAAAVVRELAPGVPARAGAAWACWRDAGWLLRGNLPGVHAAAVLRRQAIVRRQAVLRRAVPPVPLGIGTARLRCASYLAIQQISLGGRATGLQMSLRGSGSPRRTGHACATQARIRP
jgi:hypothetical protein